MSTKIDIKDVKYDYGKFIVKTKSSDGGGGGGTDPTIVTRIEALEALVSEGDNPTLAIDKINEIIAFLSGYSNTDTLSTLLSGKQDALVFNTAYDATTNKVATMADVPTTMGASGSTHKGGLVPDTPSTAGTTKFLREDGQWEVPAGGGGGDVSGKEDKVTIISAGGTALTAQVGKYYTMRNVNTMAITLPTIAASETHVQTITLYIAAGSVPNITWASGNEIQKADGFEIEEYSTYEVSAAWNGIAWVVTQVKIDTPDWSKEYLTFKALESGTFQFTNPVEYSLNNGEWTSLAASTDTPSLSAGNTIKWRATITPDSTNGVGTFSSTGRYNAMGNPLSLLLGDNFDDSTYTGANYMHYRLFYNNTKLISAANLRLAAITWAYNTGAQCYQEMFYGCTNLVDVCDIEPSVLYGACCYQMFYGCGSLVHAPYIAASTASGGNLVSQSPFYKMFYGCTSLQDIAHIPSVSSGGSGYHGMFYDCSSLVRIPALAINATLGNIANHMFYGCSSLTDASMITFTMSGSSAGYYSLADMFHGCTSLVTPPAILPAGTYRNCFDSMFYGCSSLTVSPEMPAAALGESVQANMFNGCSSLTYIKCLATDISGRYCLTNWVNGVAASGTFVKHPDMNDWPTGVNGIPSGWTVEDAVIS